MVKRNRVDRILKKKVEVSRILRYFSTFIALVILVVLYRRGIVAPLFINGEPIAFSEVVRVITSGENTNYFDKLISEKIIQYEAKKRNIKVRKEEVEEEIFKMEIQAIENGITFVQLLKERQTTIKELERDTKTRLLLYKILSEDIEISEHEIDEYLIQNQYLFEEGEEKAVREKIYEILLNKKVTRKYDSWIRDVKAESEVDYIFYY